MNNGGIGGGMMFTDVTEDYFNQIFDANFKGPYFLTQESVTFMEDGGAIVNNASTSSRTAPPGYSANGPSMRHRLPGRVIWPKNSRHGRYA